MTMLCQMEILNFLWLNWVQYLPLGPTQMDIGYTPQPPPGLGTNLSKGKFTKQNREFESTYIIPNSDFDFLDICGEEKHIKESGTRTRTVDDDLSELW